MGHEAAEEFHIPCSQVEGHRAQSSEANQWVKTREIRLGQQVRDPRPAQQQVIVLTLSHVGFLCPLAADGSL